MAKLIINTDISRGKINKNIYGHFSEHLGRCIYEGIYVGENSDIPNVNGMRKDVVEALKKINIPVLRWPGGCFADEYHWRDGIGPKESRKKMINTNWGGVVEDNSFGTHEFMELCRQLGCKPYINGNVGSGSVREMSEWVEYMTFEGQSPLTEERERNGQKDGWEVSYFGVGNENWGCGGNMTPEYYANEYRRYQTYIKEYRKDRKIYKIACGPSGDDYEWTDKLMRIAGKYMDGLSLHHYTVPNDWAKKGAACDFDDACWYRTMSKSLVMDTLLKQHSAIMDRYDPEKRVGLIVDEWGAWYDVEEGTNPGFLYQQNTMRDAVIAALNLNLFNKHCDRVKMANIAQMVNVLQAVILTEGKDMVLTPTYHVFDMFKEHQEAELVDSYLETELIGDEENKIPNLSESVSLKDGKLHVTIANLSLTDSYTIDTEVIDYPISKLQAQIITGAKNAHNTYEQPDAVKKEEYKGVSFDKNRIQITIPACSVISVELN